MICLTPLNIRSPVSDTVGGAKRYNLYSINELSWDLLLDSLSINHQQPTLVSMTSIQSEHTTHNDHEDIALVNILSSFMLT